MQDNTITILIVEDDNDWRDQISETLEGKTEYNVLMQSSLKVAKMVWAGRITNPFDLVICDGSLESCGDGLEWIKELHAKGQKVITFSNDTVDGVPQIEKYGFDRKKFITLIQKTISS